MAHLDAFSRNVIARNDDLALIDWELVGEAPIGVEVAGLFVITAVHLDVPSGDLAEFEAAVFDGYVAGLRDIRAAATDDVRMAFAAAVALRFLGVFTRIRPLLLENPDAMARPYISGASRDRHVPIAVRRARQSRSDLRLDPR